MMTIDGLITIDGNVPEPTQEQLQSVLGENIIDGLTSNFPSIVTADSNRERDGLLISSGQNLRINIVNDLNNLMNSGEKSANGQNGIRKRFKEKGLPILS